MKHRPAIRKRSGESHPDDLPGWLVRAERLLVEATRSVRLLGAVVPRNAAAERVRLLAAFEAGQQAIPRWSYARTDHALLRKALAGAAARLATESHPVAQLYAARARELEVEAALTSEVGTTILGALARARFRSTSPQAAGEATILARKWMAEGHDAPPPEGERIESDAPVAGSLLTRMREEVSRLGLPFAVVVQPTLTALAATGERHILIAPGRLLSKEDVERTVLHEVEGHAVPRARAEQAKVAIFRIGTARGIDDQEGLALVLEERHGFLGPRRKRELAGRHLAVEAMDGGATFHDCLHALVKEHGVDPKDALLVTERAYRGGDGTSAGLGRERVYLEAFLRVGAHLKETPTDETVLAAGQVSLESLPIVSPLVRKMRMSEPPPGVS